MPLSIDYYLHFNSTHFSCAVEPGLLCIVTGPTHILLLCLTFRVNSAVGILWELTTPIMHVLTTTLTSAPALNSPALNHYIPPLLMQ